MLSQPLTPMQAMFAAGPNAPRPVTGALSPMQAMFAAGPNAPRPVTGALSPMQAMFAAGPNAPRPVTGALSPMQAQFAAGPNSVGATPPMSPPMSSRIPTPNVPMAGGAPRFVSQGGALMPAVNAAGRLAGGVGRLAIGPVGIIGPVSMAAQGLAALGQAGWNAGAPQAGQDAYTYDPMGGITGLAPDAAAPSTPQPTAASPYDDHGHATLDHPVMKQMMERPKVVAKQRQAAMQRMMPQAAPYSDTRGAGMTMSGDANGIREYTAPIDMSSIGVTPAEYSSDYYQ